MSVCSGHDNCECDLCKSARSGATWGSAYPPAYYAGRIAQLEAENAALRETQFCGYCGWSKRGSSWDDLQRHIRECEKHPLRQAEAERDALRADLAKVNAAYCELTAQQGAYENAVFVRDTEIEQLKADLARARAVLEQAFKAGYQAGSEDMNAAYQGATEQGDDAAWQAWREGQK